MWYNVTLLMLCQDVEISPGLQTILMGIGYCRRASGFRGYFKPFFDLISAAIILGHAETSSCS